MDLEKPYAEDIEWCTLVQEKCEWDNCDGCINNPPTLTKHEENLKDCEFYHVRTIDKIVPATVNASNTIAKSHAKSDDLVRFINIHRLEKVGYSPVNLKQWPLFFMLKKTLGLGVPMKIYATKDEVCVTIYEDAVYLIAPRIESE